VISYEFLGLNDIKNDMIDFIITKISSEDAPVLKMDNITKELDGKEITLDLLLPDLNQVGSNSPTFKVVSLDYNN